MSALLRRPEDRRTLAFVALTYGLSFGGFFLFPSMSWPVAIVWIAVTCWFSWLCAVITHNTIHVPLFHSRGLNKFFQHVLSLAYGHPVSAFVPGHNLSHHLHTQSRRDVMRTTKVRFDWHFLNLMLAPVVLSGDIFRADLAYASAMRTERPRWFRQWLSEWVVFLTVQIVFLVMNPIAYFFVMFLPHNAAAFGIIGVNFLQHDGCDPDSEFNHSRNLTGPVINWFAFNNGYHTIHHKHPGLHWADCKKAHEEQIAPYIHPNLNEPNMLAYIWRTYFWPGVRVDYLGRRLVLPNEGPDETWIPKRDELPAHVSTGAEA